MNDALNLKKSANRTIKIYEDFRNFEKLDEIKVY